MNRQWVGLFATTECDVRVKHFVGLPPSLTGGRDERMEMKRAAFLVIEEKPDGIFLHRYADDGSYAGDTWHTTVDEAKAQASFEYADVGITWQEVPNDIDDVVSFGLSQTKHCDS